VVGAPSRREIKMAVGRFVFLSKDEIELVHGQSLECLREVGVRIPSAQVLKTLKDAGATVDDAKMVARIPEAMVEEAAKRAPRSFKMCARDPKNDLSVPVSGPPYAATTGLGVYIRDMDTGEKRPSTRKDIADFIRLADALRGVDFVWTTLTATEVNQASHGLHELWTAMQNTTKHVNGVSILSAEDAKAQVELASLVAGGMDELRKRPLFSVICCSIAPLAYEKGIVEGMVELSKAGIPIMSMSMSLSGGSAPVTMAGTICNANTENLASLVITQFSAPGAPHIYCSSSAPINMRTGSINYMTVEQCLIAASLGQMARRYSLPSMVGDWGVNDTPEPGVPHTFTETMGLCLSTMGNSDLVSGIGGLDAVKGASFDQAVIEAKLWEGVRHFMKTYTVSKETIALDVVRQVGYGNTFITHPHTARNFKSELIFKDQTFSKWEATMSRAMVPEARDIAKKLLAEHRPPEIAKDVVERGNEVIARFERDAE
jgi:trimethylamine--corrinoid protein Co-methyltransferase